MEVETLSIQANTPQGKGRSERLFGTLQCRLVAEMRLAGVKNIDQDNRFLNDLVKAFNLKFGVQTTDEESAFTELDHCKELNEVIYNERDKNSSKQK